MAMAIIGYGFLHALEPFGNEMLVKLQKASQGRGQVIVIVDPDSITGQRYLVSIRKFDIKSAAELQPIPD